MSIFTKYLHKKAVVPLIPLLLLATGFSFYASQKVSAAGCAAPATDYGRATVNTNLANAGTYRLWSRMFAPDGSNNSYLLEVDGNTCFSVGDGGVATNTWSWVDHQNGNPASKNQMTLGAGNHTLKMIGREPGVKLGRVLLLTNLNCVPTGNGDNCATIASADKEPPSVDITAPAPGANVKDVVNVTATARDNVGVTKVELYVNGVMRSSDTAAPYGFDWDTRVTANGKVNLMAKAYDTAGNVNSDSIQVNVAGGDSQVPTVPGNVTAELNAANKVVVKWTASTDNFGVAGYRIIRNDVTVGQVGPELLYADAGVLPKTTYRYQVSAFDAAGNASAPSAVVEAKTLDQADAQAPSAPADLTAKAVSPSQINLAWSPSTDNIGVAAYDVYRSSGKGAVKVATVARTSYGDTGLDSKKKYTYYVVATDIALNTSAKSAEVSAETHALPAPKPGALRGKVAFTKNSDNHAHVILRVKSVKYTYDTDQKGNYEIINLPAGTYKVTYQAKDSHDKEVTLKMDAGKIKVQDVELRKRQSGRY